MALLLIVVLVAAGGRDGSPSSGPTDAPPAAPSATLGDAQQAAQEDAAGPSARAPAGGAFPAAEGEEEASASPEPVRGELLLTVPRLEHLTDVPVPTAGGGDEAALRENVAIHLAGTGYPWQEGANVYIAGHREGYEGTPSWKAFDGVEDLRDGDEIILTVAAGQGPSGGGEHSRHTYKVYESRVVAPTDVSVVQPVPGEEVVTLQTCTLPDYAERLVVRARKVGGDDPAGA